MAQFYAAVMTNDGAALLAAALAGTAKIEFTTLVAGDGEYTEEERSVTALQARTALKSQKQSVGFSSIVVESGTSVHLTAALDNKELLAGYYVREVGLYAVDALDAEATPVLYSITVAQVADYMPPYNGLTPTTIIQEYYATVDNSANVTIEAGAGAYALADDLNDQIAKEAAFEIAQEAETLKAWDGINRIHLQGRDLTIVFASEIANYSDEWAWIQARLNAHNASGLRVGDYILIVVGTENHIAEIAGINTYRRTGDIGYEVGYHIDWITRDCYSQTVQFNTTNNNNGNASNSSPFLASNLKSWLDGTLYPLLETKLKNVIKTKRILAPYRYQSGATLTDDNSWGWQNFDKLWVPLETEIFDCLVWSTKGYGNGQAVQYPIFANSYEHRMKGAGPGGARASWWTASAYSGNSTRVVLVAALGSSNYTNASVALRVPVCFRTMEAA
ncbi:MAG: DUF6273 domain-containing protein [Stomatobaculum sp.]